ncbi:MAG: hypothetical protein RIQ81_2241 [Pseudomonadota bacterium]
MVCHRIPIRFLTFAALTTKSVMILGGEKRLSFNFLPDYPMPLEQGVIRERGSVTQ